jgi:hypothetical protein
MGYRVSAAHAMANQAMCPPQDPDLAAKNKMLSATNGTRG